MWSILVDFYSCRNQSLFLQSEEFQQDVGLSVKSLKAWKFDKIWSKRRTRRSHATTFEAGRFEFQKRSGFLKGERGKTSGCLHGRNVDRGVRLFPVILLCINSSFP